MPAVPVRLLSLPVHPHRDVDAEGYRLHVGGLVERPLALSRGDLLAVLQQRLDDDFTCIEGWVVPQLRWRGVPLGAVLAAAGVRPAARWVQAVCGEFSLPLPLAEARAALRALDLNDAPLTAAHGAPVRLLVPGGQCFTSVKWLERLEVRADAAATTAEAAARARLALVPAAALEVAVAQRLAAGRGRGRDAVREGAVRAPVLELGEAAGDELLDQHRLR